MSAHKQLGALGATMIVAGNMIGSGIFLLPAALAAIGGITLYGWLIAIIGALLIGSVFAQLAQSLPERSGMIEQITAEFGAGTGFVAAFVYWVQALIGNIAIALAVTGAAGFFFPQITGQAVAPYATMAAIWLMVLLNWHGPTLVARFEGAALAFGLIPVLLVAVGGWFWFDPILFASSWRLAPESDITLISASVQTIFWAFLGLESAAAIGALVANPARDVPRATLGGIALSALVYLGACTTIWGLVPAAQLLRSTAPFADAAGVMLGASLAALVALCAAFKASGTLAGWVLVTSQIGRTLGKSSATADRAPPQLRHLAFNGALMSLIALATASPTINKQFTMMINASVVYSLGIYALSALALLSVAARRQKLVSWGSLVAGLALLFCVAVIAGSGREMLLWGAALTAVAVTLWVALSFRNYSRSAN